MTDTAGDPLNQPALWNGTVAKILAAVLTLAALAWACRSLPCGGAAAHQRAVQRLHVGDRAGAGLSHLSTPQERSWKSTVVRPGRRCHRHGGGLLRRLGLPRAIGRHRLPAAARRGHRQHPAGAGVRRLAPRQRQCAGRHSHPLRRLWIFRLALAGRFPGPSRQPQRAADLSRARRQRRVRLCVRRCLHRGGVVPVLRLAAGALGRGPFLHRSRRRRLRPFSRWRRQDRDHRLVVIRHHFRQCRVERGVDRHRHHPDDEEFGLQGA